MAPRGTKRPRGSTMYAVVLAMGRPMGMLEPPALAPSTVWHVVKVVAPGAPENIDDPRPGERVERPPSAFRGQHVPGDQEMTQAAQPGEVPLRELVEQRRGEQERRHSGALDRRGQRGGGENRGRRHDGPAAA